MMSGGRKHRARVHSPRHLKLLMTLERSRRSLQAARLQIAAARTRSTSLVERLNERETFAHAILDGVELGIVTADPAGMVTFVNRTARELLDVSSERGLVSELLGLESEPDALLGDRSNHVLVYRLVTRNGSELDLELSVSRASSTAHDQIGFFFIFRDTREEKARSVERERLERLAALGTMVAGFAHEVRNPVASLRSLTESLAEELADAQIAMPHVSRMIQVLGRIERLVRTSLQFGRPAAPQRESCRPWSIVADAIGELAPRTRELGEELRIEVEPDLPDVYVDVAQIVQVLVILLNNALDSVGSPRRVVVQARRGEAILPPSRDRSPRERVTPGPRPVVRFEVHDDGLGVSPDIIERIFDPFFTTKPSGTGLGLSIAQQIVYENGGTIEVTSQRGDTKFVVHVPIKT